MIQPSYAFKACTKASRLSISRWFVGSSRIRICGASIAAIAISSRAFCPPDKCSTGLSTISAPMPAAPSLARNCVGNSFGRRRCICCKAVSPGTSSSSWCCAKKPTRSFAARCRPPDNGNKRSASNFDKVDLPSPFAPSKAMRSSPSSRRSRLRSTGLPSYPTAT